jgi:hypothetical protein
MPAAEQDPDGDPGVAVEGGQCKPPVDVTKSTT